MVADAAQIHSSSETVARMQKVFHAQTEAFAANPYPDVDDRREHLSRLSRLVLDNQEGWIEAISADFGHRSANETLAAEVLVTAEGIRHARSHLRKWMKPSRRKVSMLMASTSARVLYQPKGVVGIIAPWNYPLFMVTGPLICALAAGNRVMIKPSEHTPRTSEFMARLFDEHFETDHVCVITGETDVSIAFSELPLDHLFFTGSTSVGRHVMRAAADNLTPVTLELGGKSPTVIDDEVPMKMAAERICFGKSMNAGQTCVAPDYVLLPEGRRDAFVEAMRASFNRMYPTIVDNDDYTSIVDDRQYRRLQSLLQDAREKGATLVTLGDAAETLPPGSRKLPLTLVLDPTDDMILMREEIFGPVLPVLAMTDIRGALDYVNSRPRPLAMNLFVEDEALRKAFLQRSHAGGVCINDAVFHVGVDDLPFGGTGDSGMGNYHGKEGFITFSHAKSVFARPRLNTAAALYPPYGGWLQKLVMKLFLR